MYIQKYQTFRKGDVIDYIEIPDAVTAFILSKDMEKAAAKGEKIAGWIIYTVFEIVTAVLLVTAALMM